MLTMAIILLKFANKNGRFCLCAYVKGTAIRHYRAITELVDPDYAAWDPKAQRFKSSSSNAAINNRTLAKIYRHYSCLLDEFEFKSGKELFEFQDKAKDSNSQESRLEISAKHIETRQTISAPEKEVTSDRKESEITLGEWVQQVIDDLMNPTRLKPSANYQCYLTLLHKLEKEGSVHKTPLSELSDDVYHKMIKWVLNHKTKNGKGNNFVGVMKILTAAINRARKARLTTYVPDFPYMDYAPVKDITANAKDFLANGGAVKSLTAEQYQRFLDMNLDDIKMGGGAKMYYFKNLYRDFCILLYEMKSRPIDILRLHEDNIAYDPTTKRYTCTYIPAKKKNHGASVNRTSKALVIQYLTPKAIEIIKKYKGRSKGGYVFPFKLNDRRWDYNDPIQFRTHYYKGSRVCAQINSFLHKVGEYLKVPFPLTLYAFRRTAITQAITENKMPLPMIAKIAGTSVGMIEAHYANYLQALAAY